MARRYARAQHGVRPLRIDLRLEASARAKSRTMLRTGTFAHGNFQRRLSSYRARGPYFGENLAWGVGSRGSAAGVVQMWLASPSHRANLLRRSFERVGLGIYVGTFRGYGGATVRDQGGCLRLHRWLRQTAEDAGERAGHCR